MKMLGLKRIDFGAESKGDMLFAGGLIAIIVLALGLSIYTMFGDSGPGGDSDWDGKYHMQCINPNCKHTFELEDDDDELMAMMEQGTAHPGPEGLVSRCPECRKMSGVEMIQCPECEEYYVSETSRRYLLTNEYNPELGTGACPHCGAGE
jgi:hypothetical protein